MNEISEIVGRKRKEEAVESLKIIVAKNGDCDKTLMDFNKEEETASDRWEVRKERREVTSAQDNLMEII